MKKIILTAIVAFSLCAAITANAQLKEFGNVYYSVKNGDAWSGLIKMKATVKLEKPDKGDISPILLTLIENNQKYSTLTCQFEAKTADGKAFHKIIGGGIAYGDPVWTSPTGSTKITWVYLNKSIHEIHAGAPKPFDLELQFEDGSAVKYFISPAY
jgi:hypothetical protein